MKFRIISALLIALSATTTSFAQANRYYTCVDSADMYIKNENWNRAKQLLREALKLEPGNIGNALILSNLGIVENKLGNTNEALECFKIGLTITPNSFILHKNRAMVWLESDSIEQAYSDLSFAKSIDNNDVLVNKMHGYISLRKGFIAEARCDFKAILTIIPDNVDALLGLASCAEFECDNKTALEYYSKAIESEPSAETYFERALLYIKIGNLNNADSDVRDGLHINNRDGNLYLLRAYLNKQRYLNDEAEIDKKLAIEYGADAQLVQSLMP